METPVAGRFDGKVAVVTGAGGGIGREVSLLLAAEGASVVVNDLGCETDGSGSSPVPADETVDQIISIGGRAIASYDDVSTMAGGEAVMQTAVDTLGPVVDILVNSTSVLRDRMISQMSPDDFDAVVRHNLKAAFCPSRFAAVQMRRQRAGHIVNMTSDAGLGDVGRSNYAAASEGIIGLTRTVARDLGRYGVTCNAVSPLAGTRLFRDRDEEALNVDGSSTTPEEPAGIGPPTPPVDWTGPGTPDDPGNVAPLVALLCTDALPHVNGQVFGVRGGSIFLYSNPTHDRTIHKAGLFTLAELDVQVPRMIESVL